MSWMDTPALQLLERFLDLASRRHTVISSNLANIDTPGYRARDLDFGRELRRAEMQFPDEPTLPWVRQVPGLIERPDGNNVNLERETMALAEVQLRYRTGVELLRAEIRRLLTAIREGG